MEMITVCSSAIRAAGYDSASMQMKIQFEQGDTYTFCRVPAHVFDGLISASSKGRYYDRHIRDRYQC